MPGAHKFILRETGSDASHVLRNPGRTTLGRARTCDIQPSEGTVSKHHAVVEIEELKESQLEPTITVEDLQSRNGTFVGRPSQWIICNGKVPIVVGQYIKLGDSINHFILDVMIEADDVKPREDALSPLRTNESLELSASNTNKIAPAVGSLPFPSSEQWRSIGYDGGNGAVNISISTGGAGRPGSNLMGSAPVNIHIDAQQRPRPDALSIAHLNALNLSGLSHSSGGATSPVPELPLYTPATAHAVEPAKATAALRRSVDMPAEVNLSYKGLYCFIICSIFLIASYNKKIYFSIHTQTAWCRVSRDLLYQWRIPLQTDRSCPRHQILDPPLLSSVTSSGRRVN